MILSVLPGITDPASLLLFDESEVLAQAEDPIAFYVNEIMPQKSQMYVDYVTTRTLRGDVRILLQTVRRLA